MNFEELTVKELHGLFEAGNITDELLTFCQSDTRQGVQKLWKQYRRNLKEHQRLNDLYQYEYEAQTEGFQFIAGVDEAGRGPLAGPVVAAAVILPVGLFISKLNDSKKVTPHNRDLLFDEIYQKAIAVHCSVINADVIDRINIYQATLNGMYASILRLAPLPQKVLIDAVKLDRLSMPSLSIIKGDEKSASIAAASIIAKVTRDRMMMEYDIKYPQYGFAKHKGYGTAEHLAALKKYGPCPIHRKSFEPIASMIQGM